jgi:RHH-type rel operon transcriptional repressor/antitoxin RelB
LIQCFYSSQVKGVTVTVSFRLAPNIEQRLNQLAAQTGRTKAFFLRELIEGGLDDLEDYYLADAAMDCIRKGQEKLIGSDQLRQELIKNKWGQMNINLVNRR